MAKSTSHAPGDATDRAPDSEAAARVGTSTHAPQWLGKRVGRFKLVSILGRGAYGRVFLAQDVDLQRQVALKVITPDAVAKRLKSEAPSEGGSADVSRSNDTVRKAVECLIQEARAAARIEHPNVVQIYEVGRIPGAGLGGYIAMELLEGGTLQDLISAVGPLDIARACGLAAEAAEALQYGHDLGVVHRDVKPGNLMLSRIGRCKVADFGLACIDEPGDTRRHMPIAGTAQYMAPEVIHGTPPDPRSDQYSLAATLFMLLTGQPPYTGKDRRAVLEAHLHSPAPDLNVLRPDADERLAEVIQRAMSKDPSQRFANIRQFGTALRLFTISPGEGSAAESSFASLVNPGTSQHGAAELASPTDLAGGGGPSSERIPPPVFVSRTPATGMGPRWPWIAGVAATAVLVLVVGLIWLLTRSGPTETEPEVATDPPTEPQVAPRDPGVVVFENFNRPVGEYVGFPEDVKGSVSHVADGGADNDGAAQLHWQFEDITESEAAYLRIARLIEGRPQRLSIRVRAVEGSPHVWLRAGLRDGGGNRQIYTFHDGDLSTEWTTYTADVPPYLTQPLTWEDVYVVRVATKEEYTAEGTIEIDELRMHRVGQ